MVDQPDYVNTFLRALQREAGRDQVIELRTKPINNNELTGTIYASINSSLLAILACEDEVPIGNIHVRRGSYELCKDGYTETVVELDADRRRAKRSWLDCFASQQRVIGMFPIDREFFRPMRAYDFTRPPHPGELYYEQRKLGWTWHEWRTATLVT